MRLHRLELTAFGPFAGTEVIELERLTESGLFLLEGPTGAGKSTILDAITFALYGRTASSTSSSDRLHSDFADAGVRPSVTLELTVGEQRLVVTRSPEHERPKKTGTGLTREKATVHVQRRDGDALVTLATAKDEAGQLLTDAIGLSADQFTQVVVLPQGEFARFLKSDDDARRTLLTRIFSTGLYDTITDELERRRTEGTRAREAAVDAVGRAVAAAVEAAEIDGDAAASLPDLRESERATAFEEIADDLRAALAAADAELEAATDDEDEASGAHTSAVADLAAHTALAAARDALAAHLATTTEHDAQVEERRRALAAAPVAVLLAQLVESHDALLRSTQAVSELVEAAATVPASDSLLDVDLSAAEHEAQARRLDADAVALAHLVALDERYEQRATDAAAATHAAAASTAALTDLLAETDELPDRLRHAEQRFDDAATSAARLPSASAGLDELRRRRTALRELEELAPLWERTRAELTAADDERRASVDVHQSLVARLLDGMAASLARQLVPGDPCAVCGSTEHPHPAASGADDVTTEQVDRAARRRSEAEAEVDRLRDELAVVSSRRAELSARADAPDTAQPDTATLDAATLDAATLDAELLEAARVVDEAEQAQASLASLREQVETCRAASLGSTARLTAASGAESLARHAAEQARAALADDEATLVGARGGHASVSRRQAALHAGAEWHRRAAVARRELDAALAARDACLVTAESAAVSAGFAGLDDVAGAVCSAERIADLDVAIDAWTTTAAVLSERLSEPGLAGLEVADVEGAGRRVQQAETSRLAASQRREAAARRRTQAQHRRARFADRRADVAAAEERHAAVVADTAAVVRLAGLAKGTSGSRRMTLTSYVLRRWFDQVVAAANIRLASMSHGRYQLERTEDSDRRNERTGLGLAVIDRHTGDSRSPASLSGGETFYTSLALALGLADVVRADAGGVDLDTLFIDEGFGSLDPDTLDQVMTVIDELRENGRAVGIVSHVADLKDRIPERLEVRVIEGRGSTTRVVA